MNIEVPTKYSQSHNDRTAVLAIRFHSKSPMLYRPALHGNLNALSLARRALKDKFPTPTIPLTAVLPNRQVFLPDPVFHVQPEDGHCQAPKHVVVPYAVYYLHTSTNK